jgi:RNA recognition motif. (a.k.a. RRM, RBD, or RNP domain)
LESHRLHESMSDLHTLYFQLRAMAFQDPLIRDVMTGMKSWADVSCTPQENLLQEQYTNSAECRAFTDAVLREVNQPREKEEEEKEKEKEVPNPNPNNIKTIITQNLPRDVTLQELRTTFEKYGPVKDIYIPKNTDKNSVYFGTVKGFALIKYLTEECSTKAYLGECNRFYLRGKLISVEFAKEDR